mmetsp:Transcript_16425/g.22646  ORF Transcript_16425/g.22646 Transcript_16425/m.22646 type:complete len:426 (+) Transcript_16425:17-1294(+)
MSALLLSDRQRAELEEAIFDYLSSQGSRFTQSANAFKIEAEIHDGLEMGKGQLEKKWVSVLRLQRRVMELEAVKPGPSANAESGPSHSLKPLSEQGRAFPKGPAKHCLTGHRGPVTVVACHPLYTTFASGSEDSTIRLWDCETGQFERSLKGHTGAITGVAFDPKGDILATASADMTAKLWSMQSYTCTKTLRSHDHSLGEIKFLPLGDKLLTTSRDQSIKLWEVSTGYCLNTFNGHTDWVKCISISLDGLYFASSGIDQTIIIWQISNGHKVQTLTGHEHVVEALCYGRRPADAASIMAAAKAAETAAPKEAVVTTAGTEYSYLASGSRDRSIKLWDPLHGSCLMTITSHENWVRGLQFHSSFKFLISCSDDKSIRISDLKDGRCTRTIADAHSHFVSSIALCANYPLLVSGSVDGNVCVWNCT